MTSAARKREPIEFLRQDLLKACEGTLFEVHHGPPPFWNSDLDGKLEIYLAQKPRVAFTTCPICGHHLEAPKNPEEFHDPWWIYPQRGFHEASTCSHFELLTFSILWNHSEPFAPPWLIPCGWGTPAMAEVLSQNENLLMSLKVEHLPNGATIFWTGLYRRQPGIPLPADFWPLPVLKARTAINPSLNSRGFWGEFVPISTHTPFIWSQLFLHQADGKLISYETEQDTDIWLPKLRNWNKLAYNQPMKMYKDRFVTESGFASFAIGMRSTRTKGALFISQTPIACPNPVLPMLAVAPMKESSLRPVIQPLNQEQIQDLSQTETLWAVVDPFQNEAVQDWLRLIRRNSANKVLSLWSESEIGESWKLTADASQSATIKQDNLTDYYRDLSPLIIHITPDVFELSRRYPLGSQSWGMFFLSEAQPNDIHYFLRQRLVCHYQTHWIYFRFFEVNFLSAALSLLNNEDLKFFYGPIEGWIIRHPSENSYTLYSHTGIGKNGDWQFSHGFSHLPRQVHETAQRVFQTELPRRIKEFIKDRTPEFADLIPISVIDRWVRDSVRQANSWGIKKETHLIKFFLWKVLITPTWCHLSPFVRLLQQPVAEEVKIQNIENLFPQLRASEIPRGLAIESWDAELWTELRKHNSPLANADPEAFHPLLGERPPAMPLNNPKWLKALGLFYESAYADLFSQSGVKLLNSAMVSEVQRPLHAPPRLISLSSTELVVRDEGTRTKPWLKQHGFEGISSTQGHWIHRSSNPQAILMLARQFLEEFPYLENRYIFDFLSAEDRQALSADLEIYSVIWDAHNFWSLHKI
ncbi:MAG: hypothetical protein RJB66_2243 [Pseudomonadota bacterium]|jgi:hypothetical protein